jgi:hypothetical protein
VIDMAQNFKHVSVLDRRYWSDSQRIHVWPTIFNLDNEAFEQIEKKLEDSSVEKAEKVSSIILWRLGIDKNVTIALMDEEEG